MSRQLTDLEVLHALRPAVSCFPVGDEPGAVSEYDCVPVGVESDEVVRAGLQVLLEIESNRAGLVDVAVSEDDPWRQWFARMGRGMQARRELLVSMLGDERPEPARTTGRAASRPESELSLLVRLAFVEQSAYVLAGRLADRAGDSGASVLRALCADHGRCARFLQDMLDDAFRLAPDTAASAVAEALRRHLDTEATPTRRLDTAMLRAKGVQEVAWDHRQVVDPVLSRLKVLDRTDLGASGERAQATIASLVRRLEDGRREDQTARQVRRDREARRREREAAFLARMGIVPEMAL